MAKSLNLKGVEVIQWLEVAGKEYEKLETKMYSLTIIDRDGEKHKLTAMGLDRIASNPGYVNVDCAYKIFSHVSPGSLERAVGEVGLLIGQDNAALLASGGDGPNVFENLRMMKRSTQRR